MIASGKLPSGKSFKMKSLKMAEMEKIKESASVLAGMDISKILIYEPRQGIIGSLVEFDGQPVSGSTAEVAYYSCSPGEVSLLKQVYDKLNGTTDAEDKAFFDNLVLE